MRRFVRPVNLLFAALLVLASCDAVNDNMLEPAPPVQADHIDGMPTTVPGDTGRLYTLVEADIRFPKMSASKWINKGGGTVILEGTSRDGTKTVMHVLLVPEGAVSHRTLFTVSIASPHFIKVDLRAQVERKVKGESTLIDVGHLGFNKPVLLALDHTLATNVADRTRLTVLHDPENGQPWENMRGFFYEGYENFIVAYLPHFSKYAVALD